MYILREEGALVESFAAHPRGHFAVAFARIAGAAGGHNVADGVAAAARDRLNAVLLQHSVGGGAIRTTTPFAFELFPLLGSEIVVGGINATFAAACGASASSLSHSHTAKLVHRWCAAAATGVGWASIAR
ncbi:hypothetical protein A20C1_12440 [marine actinobacterium PHSC20C1]|nr:hypothetical protein A20C1_12440 [marine actinobacterium PHSC20C1]